MKPVLKLILKLGLCLLAANLLISCAPQRKAGVIASAGQPEKQQGTVINGTSDSGGGTGVEGKVFESYVFDPVNSEAYQKHLKNFFDGINKSSEDQGENGKLEYIFRTKTWFVAPVELEKLNKSVLGVEFFSSDTQQIAIQTSDEIWINKTLFDQMSSKEQAELLIHEYIMIMYFMKHYKISEFCKFNALLGMKESKDSACGTESVEIFDQEFPPEPEKPLDDKDNQNIRRVTSWVLSHLEGNVTEEQFYKVLFNSGFDKRFFNPKNLHEEKLEYEAIKMTREEIFKILEGAQMTGHLPELCHFVGLDVKMGCKVSFSRGEKKIGDSSLPILEIKVSFEDKSIQHQFFLGEEYDLDITKEDGSEWISLGLSELHFDPKAGTRMSSGLLFLSRPSDDLDRPFEVETVFLKPGIITSVDKAKDPVCQVQDIRAKKFADDKVSVTTEGRGLNLVQRTLLKYPPFVGCIIRDVD